MDIGKGIHELSI